MRKFSTIVAIFFLTTFYMTTNAQVVALYRSAPHCIFLKSDQNMYITLIYYNNAGEQLTNIKRNTGYSIDDNLSKDNKGRLRLKLNFNKVISENTSKPMTVNLYFDKMPDTINYYLNISEFKSGSDINVSLPSKLDKKVNVEICCKGTPNMNDIRITWPTVPAYDITNIVFPANKEK